MRWEGLFYPGHLLPFVAVKTDKRAVAGWKPDRPGHEWRGCGAGPLTAAFLNMEPNLTEVSGPF